MILFCEGVVVVGGMAVETVGAEMAVEMGG